MRLQDLMSTSVETASPRDTAAAAWERMRSRRIHHLVVVDQGEVAGIVSERDLGGPRGAAARDGKMLADLMTRHVVSADPTTTVRKAANLLRGHVVGCLPVFDGRKLVGIVTVSDLLELIGRGAERPVATTKRWTLKHRGARRQAGKIR